ncbi:uncharacterized protein LOC120707709 [Panicum virgatum]|uniref:uncharacterized protein LOC120707709 n=1 Tax=Panicum virgatum TaxID=38727 RepID=UPI0019D68973|nr:uncharacterized protein LOC120707709 [Panicum virgatum]
MSAPGAKATLAVSPDLLEASEELPLAPTATEEFLLAEEEVPPVSSSPEAFALARRHSAPDLFSPTEVRVRWAGEGSRFWALASGESSDEECEDVGKGSTESGGDGDLQRDTLDTMLGAPF